MSSLRSVLFFFLTVTLSLSEGQLLSLIETNPEIINDTNLIVSAVVNAQNVTIDCAVEIIQSDDSVLVVNTQWGYNKNNTLTFLDFNPDGTSANMESQNFRVTPNAQRRRNLTILVFDSSLDGNQITCGAGEEVAATFDLRIIRLPVLTSNGITVTVSESSDFTYTIQSDSGFPVVPDYMWSHNNINIPINNTDPNVATYPNITFNSVSRNDSGNYSITVSNEAGSVSTFFILDVQYKPEGVPENGPIYVLEGNTIIITSFSNIDGNPFPNSTWTFNGSLISEENRLNSSIVGQLTITSTDVSDTGNYTNTLTNTIDGNDMSIVNTIELIVAAPPSMPRNVTVLNTGPEYINISWINPSYIGVGELTQFRIIAVSNINTVNITVNATVSDDTLFVNTLNIEGLKPNTQYTITVSAISSVIQIGSLLESDPSNVISDNTTLGAPSLRSANVSNINGSLSVSYMFLHTGGSNLETVTVQCSMEGNEDNVPVASGDPLAVILYCTTDECINNENVLIGPVSSGVNYSCYVTAENDIGEDSIRTNYIVTNTGIPSMAVLLNVTGGDGVAYLTLRVDNFGVTNASDFRFLVSIFRVTDSVKRAITTTFIETRQISPDSIDNPIVTITVDNLGEGSYVFSVLSSNRFSTPNITNMTTPPENSTQPIIVMPPSTSTSSYTIFTSTTTATVTGTLSTTSTLTPTVKSSSSGLSGGAIAGIIIAVIIILAILAIVAFIVVYIVYQNRGDSYRVEGNKVKVEEHDIDIGTELKDAKSTDPLNPSSDYTETPTNTSATGAKPELHYADLADFAPSNKKSQAPPAKPMPIEEVQYAVIRPQDKPPVTNPTNDSMTGFGGDGNP